MAECGGVSEAFDAERTESDFCERTHSFADNVRFFADHVRPRVRHIAILSNHYRKWFDAIANAERSAPFGDIVPFSSPLCIVSSDVACAKPESEIYELTMRRLMEADEAHSAGAPDAEPLRADEVLFIDDQERNTVAAESAVGWRTLLYNALECDEGERLRVLQARMRAFELAK